MEWHCIKLSWKVVNVLLILSGTFSLIAGENLLSYSDYLSDRVEKTVESSVYEDHVSFVDDTSSLVGDSVGEPEKLLVEQSFSPPDLELISLQGVLNCGHISNGIVRQFNDTLYLLSGNQFFRLDVLPDKQFISPLATFDAFTEVATDFDVHPWRKHIIVVITFRSHYNVHKIHVAKNETEAIKYFNRTAHPEQRIPINPPGLRSLKVKLFSTKDNLYLLRAENNERNSSGVISITTYRKQVSYFTNSYSINIGMIDVFDVTRLGDGLLILAVQYCHENCHRNSIRTYNANLTQLQNMFTDSRFLKLAHFKNEPRLIECLPNECSIHQWEDGHFVNPYKIALDFNIIEMHGKRHHYFMRSQENDLYLFSRKEKKPEAKIHLPDVFGRVQINAISTDFERVYLIVTSINETALQFRFYDVKNDTNVMVSSDVQSTIRDPFDVIEGCANRLKQQFDIAFAMLTKLNAVLPKIQTTETEEHFAKITINNRVDIQRSVHVGEIKLRSDPNIDAKEIAEKLKHIRERTREARLGADQLLLINDTTPLMRSNDVQSSLLIAKTIRVKNLQTAAPLFNNLITKTGRNFLKGNLTVGRLIAPQLHVPLGIVNKVALAELYLNRGGDQSAILGRKAVKDLRVNRMKIDGTLNGFPVKNIVNRTRDFQNPKKLRLKNVRAKKLTVEQVYGINVGKFLQNFYRADDPELSSQIQGNLLILKPVNISNLRTRFLNRIPITNYLTLKGDQNITRKVIFKSFFVHNLEAKLINGIEFGKTVAIQGETNFIESRVNIHQMKILNKLILSEQENREMTQHIVGTRVEDLTQSYTGRVIIKGNLILHNLTLENPVNLYLGDKKFPLDSLSKYWTRNTNQKIKHKVLLKGKITTTQLLADKINNHPADSFVSTDQEIFQSSSNVQFKDTLIERNIRINGTSKIVHLSRNAVRKDEKTVLEGIKRFENLTTGSLISSHINGQQISNHFVAENEVLQSDRKITFDELHLHTDVECPEGKLEVETIDGLNVDALFADAVYINQPMELVSVQIGDFAAEGDLNVETLNGINTSGALEAINNLRFVVNVTGGSAAVQRLFVDTINGVHVRDYFNTVVRKDREYPQQLGGRKKFLEGLTVSGELRVRNISEVDVDHWMRNVLLRDERHTVTEEWVFKEVQVMDNLNATKINEMPTKFLINSGKTLNFPEDLDVNELTLDYGRIISERGHNWTQVVYNLINPLPRKWQSVEVTGDVFTPPSKSKLGEIITHGMNNRHSQAIHGEVYFSGLTKVKNLYTHNRTINGIDLGYVLQDTLLDNSLKVQTITGPVVFENGFEARSLRAANLNAVQINDINLISLNQSLWRPSFRSPLPPLYMPRVSVDKLTVKGMINGISVQDLNVIDQVNVHGMRIAQNFTVRGNLQIDYINGIPFNHLFFGAARLTAKKPQYFTGSPTFENLVIRGASRIRAINGIPLKSLLLSKSHHLQEVTGLKSFTKVYFNGPSSVTSMNDVSLGEKYQSVLDKNRNQFLSQFNARQIVAEKGLNISKSLNDIPIEFFSADQLQLPNIKEMQEQLNKILTENWHHQKGRRKRFNYFDYAHDFVISPEGNDSSHRVLNRYTRSDCPRSSDKCLCKRQVEIQMPKLNEIQLHHPTTDLHFNGKSGAFDIQISVNNSCDPEKAHSILRVAHGEHQIKTNLKGSAKLIGSISSNGTSSVFITSMEYKQNLTITTWNVSRTEGLRGHRTLVFANSKRSTVHLLQHKTNHLLVISTKTAVQQNPFVSFVYLYDPPFQGFKLQHILRTYYDLFSSVQNEQDSYLAAGLSGDKWMDIYKVYLKTEGTHQLSLRAKIPFQTPIKDLLAFSGQDQLFIATLLENGYLYIYRYNYVEGWQQESSGNFRNIPSVEKLSLISVPPNDLQYLVITGANSSASLISIN